MSMSMPVPAPMHTAGGWRSRVQRFGGFLAAMVIPNIGAFLAWGLITAFFIPTGWIPNEDLAQLVDPMIFFLLPILIGYTGGYLIHGQRGAVVGAIATAGVAIGGSVGTEVGGELVRTPMFLGAMIMGPLGGWLIKQFDQAVMQALLATPWTSWSTTRCFRSRRSSSSRQRSSSSTTPSITGSSRRSASRRLLMRGSRSCS